MKIIYLNGFMVFEHLEKEYKCSFDTINEKIRIESITVFDEEKDEYKEVETDRENLIKIIKNKLEV